MIDHYAHPATDVAYVLGEGPVWDAVRQRVLWVDIRAGRVHSGHWRGDRVVPAETWQFDETVGAVGCAESGELLVAGARQLYTVAADGTVSTGARLLPESKNSRTNDGGCDPSGRFLIGTMALDDRVGDEQLLRVEPDGQLTVVDDDLSLSNGLAFSPDGTWFYHIDTTPGLVWVRAHDPLTGVFGPRRELLRVEDANPDGMCLDSLGNLWVAIWGGGQVRCFSPTGGHLATVHVPAPNTTSVAFVGPELDTLLITTAAESMTDAQQLEFPQAGRLFHCDVGVTGLPVAPWRGSAPDHTEES